MSDRKIILNTLKFLKETGDQTNRGVSLKGSKEFSMLEPEVKERIRDKLVINQYASFPFPGDQWKLSITWHPNGGVDILNKKFKKCVLRPDGKLRYTYKGWIRLKEHAVTIIVSVIGGIFLFLLTDLVIKPKFRTVNKDDAINNVDTVNSSTKIQLNFTNDSIESKPIEKE